MCVCVCVCVCVYVCVCVRGIPALGFFRCKHRHINMHDSLMCDCVFTLAVVD